LGVFLCDVEVEEKGCEFVVYDPVRGCVVVDGVVSEGFWICDEEWEDVDEEDFVECGVCLVECLLWDLLCEKYDDEEGNCDEGELFQRQCGAEVCCGLYEVVVGEECEREDECE